MAMGPKICVFLLAVLSVAWGDHFDCLNLLPEGKTMADTEQGTVKPFRITSTRTKFLPGEFITVKIEGKNGAKLTKFLLQGRHPDSTVTVGFFPRDPRSPYQVETCSNPGDTATSVDLEELMAFPATSFIWKAPAIGGVEHIEFVATVVDEDGGIWTDIHSIILTLDPGRRGNEPDPLEGTEAPNPHNNPNEMEGGAPDSGVDEEGGQRPNEGEQTPQFPPEIPNEGEMLEEKWRQEALARDREGAAREASQGEAVDPDLAAREEGGEEAHNALSEAARAAKWEELQAKLIQDEDTYGEGDWQLEELKRQRAQEEERHWEEMEYERRQSEEQRKREEMIRWEMRDKEEYDSQQLHSSTTASPAPSQSTTIKVETKTEKAGDSKENDVIKEWEEEIKVEEEIIIKDNKPQKSTSGVSHLVSSVTIMLFGVAIYFL